MSFKSYVFLQVLNISPANLILPLSVLYVYWWWHVIGLQSEFTESMTFWCGLFCSIFRWTFTVVPRLGLISWVQSIVLSQQPEHYNYRYVPLHLVSISLKILSPVVVPCRLLIEANSLSWTLLWGAVLQTEPRSPPCKCPTWAPCQPPASHSHTLSFLTGSCNVARAGLNFPLKLSIHLTSAAE